MARYGDQTGWDPKDPDEVLDYAIDWSNRLGSDTIATSTWIVPDGIMQVSASVSGAICTIWLSGGALDQNYSILNRITTAGGRTMDRTTILPIRSK